MSEYENEHQRWTEGLLGRDFVSMTPEAIALRELIDHIGEVAIRAVAGDEAA